MEALRRRAETQPEDTAYLLLFDGEEEREVLTYGELDRRARNLAARLLGLDLAGRPALLLYPSGLDFIVAFFGCLYAGVVAVPAYPPDSSRRLGRLQGIVLDADPALVLATGAIVDRIERNPDAAPQLASIPRLATEALSGDRTEAWREPKLDGESLAFLQYTSGSTAAPRGVRVRHAELVHNQRMIQQAFGQTSESVVVSWLPLFHDMGLIGGVLQPLWVGGRCVLMSPVSFLQRPSRWLEAISRYRGTTSGGPNFAYDLCAERVGEEDREGLDLSCWSVAFNGSEPVRAQTLDRFAAAFAPSGFRRRAFFPCYGLAEATLFVTGSNRGPTVRHLDAAELRRDRIVHRAAADPRARPLVGCGPPWGGQEVAIVDPATGERLAGGRVGEIWIRGGSVAGGYAGHEETARETFGAVLGTSGPFLRTGDLGFLAGGELFVTGRLKDLVILRGRNLHPHDIERTVEGIDAALVAGGGAAFGVDGEEGERLVVVHEVLRRAEIDAEALGVAVREAVAREHEARVSELVLVRRGGVPRTSSGKIRRQACRARYLAGELPVVAYSRAMEPLATPSAAPPALSQSDLAALDPLERRRALVDHLAGVAETVLGRRPEASSPLVAQGLDSVAAIELGHRVASGLDLAPETALDPSRLLDGATLDGLAEEIGRALDATGYRAPIPRAPGPAEGDHPLSHGQAALLYLARRTPQSPAWHVTAAARLSGGADPVRLRSAAEALVARHPSLRTTFHTEGGAPLQRVHASLGPDWAAIDAAEWSAGRLDTEIAREAHRPFDLTAGPLLRLRLYTGSAEGAVLLLAAHHVVVDLWSLTVLVRDLGLLLREDSAASPLPPSTLRYTDYVRWARAELDGPEGERLWDYWRDDLAGELPVLELPTDRPRPPVPVHAGDRRLGWLDRNLAAAVGQLGRGRGATLFMTLLALFQILLHRFTGQEDVVLGSPVTGRPRAELAEVVGYFVNMVVLRAALGDDPPVVAAVDRARGNTLGALAHGSYPFSLLAERLATRQEKGRSPLFQAAFVLQGVISGADGSLGAFAVGRPGASLDSAGLRLESYRLAPRGSQFDLTLTAVELEEGLALSLVFDREIYDGATAERLLESFEVLAHAAAAEPHRRLGELPLLSPGREAEVRSWSRARTPAHEAERCLHRSFEAHARSAPDAVALVRSGEFWTYGEVDRRGNGLARRLRSRGIGPEARVAICLGRSPEMVWAILAVLKAGGAYVPLDPRHPPERTGFVLADAGAHLVITREALLGRLSEAAERFEPVCLDGGGGEDESAAALPPDFSERGAGLDHLAYLIYTSGSTGRPKGVEVTHRNAARLFAVTAPDFDFGADDVWTLFHAVTFDFSVWELWGALIHGGRLVVVPYSVSRDPAVFRRLLVEERVTVLSQTPSAFRQLVRVDDRAIGADRLVLRWVIFGGEALDLASLEPWVARYGAHNPSLVNMYGITETTVHVTHRRLDAGDLEAAFGSPIGRPLRDLSLHLLDRRLRPVPVGVVGEIHVGGGGVARGYHGRPSLTAARFVPDPSSGAGGRLYQSGDLARWRDGGDLHYLGRADHQVKVRGFRIEPGEVEAALVRHPAVHEASILAREETGETVLVAYLVAAPQAAPTVDELRSFLAARLPEAMMPAAFVTLERLPLTANGKLDRRALPAPGANRPSLDGGYVAPRTSVERELAAVWSEVLGIERIGVNDDYFALGGDSIRSLGVQARAAERGLHFDLEELFRHHTLEALAEHLRGAGMARAERSSAEPSVGGSSKPTPFTLVQETDRRRLPAGLEDAYPLGQVLSGLVFQSEASDEYAVYTTSLLLRGTWDPGSFEAAAAELVERHPILRTGFDFERFHEPLQLVYRTAAVTVKVADLRALPPARREAEVAAWLRREQKRRFEWSRPPLVRFHLHRLDEGVFQFTLVEPLLDGWSVASLLTELFSRAAAHGRGERLALGPLACSVRDFVALEVEAVRSPETREYWRRHLDGAVPSRLPRWPGTALVGDLPVRRVMVPIPEPLSDSIQALARRLAVPLKSVLLAAHLKTVSLCTGERDVTVGLLANGRPESRDGDRVLGLFLNAVAFRHRLRGESWEELIDHVFAAEADLLPHRRQPLAEIRRDLGVADLFDTVFNFTHFHVYRELERLPGVEVLEASASEQTYFDLTVQWNQDYATGELGLYLDALGSRLPPAQVAAIGEVHKQVLAAMTAAPAEPEDRVVPLPRATRHQLLVEWNDSGVSPPAAAAIHRAFEVRAKAHPERLALVRGSSHWSFGEVEARANRLARHLRRSGLAREELVAVVMARSPETVVAILAVLKAGGAYVPLDGAAPPERLAFMLADCGARRGLTQENLLERLRAAAPAVRFLVADREGEEVVALASEPLDLEDRPDQLAYVIYTSGSTGRPKGVLGLHGATLNRLAWMERIRPFAAGEVGCQKTFLSFVDAVAEIFAPLLAGVPSVVLDDPMVRDPELLVAGLAEGRATRLVLVPSLLRVLLDSEGDLAARLPGLATWVSSGEALPAELVRRFHERVGGSRGGAALYNLYGSSEVAADVTWFDTGHDVPSDAVPIGRPIDGCRAHVLDPRLTALPAGAKGQLAVAGTGLARGYLRRPGATAVRFVPDPLSAAPGARLYLTGDLARRLPGGEIVHLGRLDQQIQVRGMRVELGEVEAALRRHPAVAQAVVRAWDGAGAAPGPRLAAYVVGAGGAVPSAEELRRHLRAWLPDHMVPTDFQTMAALALTPSGKVDRRALPPPRPPEPSADGWAAPRTPVEETLAGLWADVLGLDRVGTDEEFHALGGHSLLAVQVASRVRRAFGVELPLRRLLASPTVAELAAEVAASRRGAPLPPLEPSPRDVAPPLSFAQRRLAFLDRLHPGNPVYNLPGTVRLVGPLDVVALARAVDEIVARHETLRTTFITRGGETRQRIAPRLAVPLRVVDLRTLPATRRGDEGRRRLALEARRPFDLASGPLLRTTVVRLAEEEHVFQLTLHHIVSDGWSLAVFVDEMVRIYEAAALGMPLPLGPLPVQYADYAQWQHRWLTGEVLERQVAYWRECLGRDLPVVEIPGDRPRPRIPSHRGGEVRFDLEPELVRAAGVLARRDGSTLFMTLLASFQVLLGIRAGADDVVVGTDVANRNLPETEGMIGFFVNQLVLRVSLAGDPSFLQVLARVREAALQAYDHQDLPFDRVVEVLNPERELNRTPLFQVKFVLQNAPRPLLAASGLTITPVDASTGTAKFDLLLNLWPDGEGLRGALEYSSDLYDPATARHLLDQYVTIVRQTVERPEEPIAVCRRLLEDDERARRRASRERWGRSGLARLEKVKPRPVAVRPPAHTGEQ